MVDSNLKSYNQIVDLIESCTNDLIDFVDLPIEECSDIDLFSFITGRLSIFALEIIKFYK